MSENARLQVLEERDRLLIIDGIYLVVAMLAPVHPDFPDFGAFEREGIGEVIKDLKVTVEIRQLFIVYLLGK